MIVETTLLGEAYIMTSEEQLIQKRAREVFDVLEAKATELTGAEPGSEAHNIVFWELAKRAVAQVYEFDPVEVSDEK